MPIQTRGNMRTFVLPIFILNLAAILVGFGLRHYAKSAQKSEAEETYQSLIREKLVDEAKADIYAQEHKASHPREWLRGIGNTDGFVQWLIAVIILVCGVNSLALLSLTRRKRTHVPCSGSLSP